MTGYFPALFADAGTSIFEHCARFLIFKRLAITGLTIGIKFGAR